VQRTKTLAKKFPSSVEERLRMYGRWATRAGDKRWKKYAEDEEADNLGRDRKGPEEPDLGSPSSLLLRLRAGFGVSAKADVLAFLLGIGEQPATTKKAAGATGYSRATVHGALDDLSRAGFIQRTGTHAAEYFALIGPWRGLLQGPGDMDAFPPTWRYWGQVYAFLARARQWAQGGQSRGAQSGGTRSEYVMSTRARDVFEEFRGAFEANRIQVPSPTQYRGEEYLDGFVKTAEEIIQWIPEHV
jgi:hypothetical protein